MLSNVLVKARWWAFVVCGAAAFGHRTAAAQEPVTSATPLAAPPARDAKEESLAHFEKGKELYKADSFAPALAEFIESRRLFPTRNATLDAALCLTRLSRLDEALGMYETLLREFPDLPEDLKRTVQTEIVRLKTLVGVVEINGAEPGAAIAVDGRSRGEYPPVTPLRVGAGSHVVRVYKEGFEPFETSIDVAGGSTVSIAAHLRTLQQTGRMSVTERAGKALEVIVDGSVVGKTPWVGPLVPGDHTVVLRGDGLVGTQPVSAPVTLGRTTPLVLDAEELKGWLRVMPTPAGVAVAVDGVAVGHGAWEGRLRTGAHKIEVAAPGFVTGVRELSLAEGERTDIGVVLVRDAGSPFWERPVKMDPRTIGVLATGSVGLAAIAVGAVTGAMAIGEKSTIDAKCYETKTGTLACTKSGRAAADRALPLAGASTAMFAVGLGGIATAAILYFTRKAPGKPAKASAATTGWSLDFTAVPGDRGAVLLGARGSW